MNSDNHKRSRPAMRGTGFADLIAAGHTTTGFAGGVLGFYLSKALARMVNLRKKAQKISPDTVVKLNVLFPEISFSDIRIVCNAWLPAHIFNRSIEGMTFHNRIYITHRDVQNNLPGFLLLVHELVHIRQIRERGEFVFACKYGAQFLRNGGYSDKMPYEHEAYEFVDKNRYRVPDIT